MIRDAAIVDRTGVARGGGRGGSPREAIRRGDKIDSGRNDGKNGTNGGDN